MPPDTLKAARKILGVSAEKFAMMVGVSAGRSVRRWESGQQAIPGPIQTIVTLTLLLPEVRAYLLAKDPAMVPVRRLHEIPPSF